MQSSSYSTARWCFAAILVTAIVWPGAAVRAATDSLWATQFGPTGVIGDVLAFSWKNDSLYLAGDMVLQTGATSSAVKFGVYDTQTSQWKRSSIGPKALNDQIRVVLDLPPYGTLFGGDFSFNNGERTLSNLALREYDGNWSSLTGDSTDGIDGPVNALLWFEDRLFIGGEFTQVGDGINTPAFAIWDPNTGFQSFPSALPGSPAPVVHALEWMADGFDRYVFLGGEFELYGGSGSSNVARYSVYANLWFNMGPGVDGPVYALERSGNNGPASLRVLIGGEFQTAGLAAADNLAMYDLPSDSFDVQMGNTNGPVFALQSPGDSFSDQYLVGGEFDSVGTMESGGLAIWNHGTMQWDPSPVPVHGDVYAIGEMNDWRFPVGGDFDFIADSARVWNVFLLHAQASDPDTTWLPLGYGLHPPTNIRPLVADVEFDTAGNLYACGIFKYGGGTKLNYIGRWDGERWNALGEGLNISAGELAVRGDTVYVAGPFSEAGGIPVNGIAMWDGTQWNALGEGLPNATIRTMELDTLGHLYVAGIIDSAGTVPTKGIAMWDGVQWSAVGPVVDYSVSPFDLFIDSLTNELFMCGQFDSLSDAGYVGDVARWNGNFWTPMGSPDFSDFGSPRVITQGPSGHLIVAGNINTPSLRSRDNGGDWIVYAGDAIGNYTDILSVGCDVFLTGDHLTSIGGTDVDDIGRITLVGVEDMNADPNDAVQALAPRGKQLAVAGEFRWIGGCDAYGLSIWSGLPGDDPAGQVSFTAPTEFQTLDQNTVFDITWDPATTAEFVAIEVSLDSGYTWSTVHNRADASRGHLSYLVPDTIEVYCKFRISDADALCAGTDEVFFTIGFAFDPQTDWLRRRTGTYYDEPFVFGDHQWSFRNDSNSVWPSAWYLTLDYSKLAWPVSNNTNLARFPDWWLFCEGWGDGFCYRNKQLGFVRPSAYEFWVNLSKRGWEGSCYGFAVSDLLLWRRRQLRDGVILYREYAYQLPLDDFWRFAVNKYWSYQLGPKHLAYSAQTFNDRPMTTLRTIRDSSLQVYQLPRVISMFSMRLPRKAFKYDWLKQDIRGHTMVPYRVTNTGTGEYRIYVYDNNGPNDTTRYISVDSASNTWNYYPDRTDSASEDNWLDTCCGLFTSLPINEFEGTALSLTSARERGGQATPAAEISDSMTIVLMSATEDIVITDSAGNRLGNVEDTALVEIPSGIPIVPREPDYALPRPLGYYFPAGNYDVVISGPDTAIQMLWQAPQSTYRYERTDGDTTDTDRICIDSAISVVNPDARNKATRIISVLPVGSADEYYADISNMNLASGDSLSVQFLPGGNIRIDNVGAAKQYDLLLWASTFSSSQYTQALTPIDMQANSTHEIAPDWENLVISDITILLDQDRDGIYEDTTTAAVPTATGETDDAQLPGIYALGQNYPNPFNPSTRISYTIPKSSDVLIRVFNVLGQQVHVFREGRRAAGTYEVSFNAGSVGQPLASGVYFYRIEAGDFKQTKRMLLLK